MKSHLVSGLLFTCFAALGAFGGCVVDVDPQQTGDEGIAQSEAVTPAGGGAFYELFRCRAPYCNGYFVKEVNNHQANSIVTQVIFSGFDEETIADIKDAPHGDIIVRGRFVLPMMVGVERRFVVTEAYRGLPGVEPVDGDIFFGAPARRPPIVCFAAPCNNIIAKPLNSEQSKPFTRLYLDRALKPFVDGAWVEHQILRHDALVSGHFREGDMLPGGRELVMEVGQVYLKLPVEQPMCMVLPHPICADHLRATFNRDVNRCLEFDTCADMSECLFLLPPKCDAGYVRKSWPTEASPCWHYACDPAFAH